MKKLIASILAFLMSFGGGVLSDLSAETQETAVPATVYTVETESESTEEAPVETDTTEPVKKAAPENEDLFVEQVEDAPTLEEKIAANRNPDSDIWYHIEDEDCPGHEWEYADTFRYCLICGCSEDLPVETAGNADG